jgi:O-antigen ligase
MRHGDDTIRRRADWLFAAAAFQLAVALLVGGTARPLHVLLCFAASLPTLALLLMGTRHQRPGWIALLALGLYTLAWLQLVPLPPELWTALPGRELAVQVLETVRLPLGWRPLALDPGAAGAALASTAAPLVLLLAAARLRREEQRKLLVAVVALALVTAVLGVFQRLTGTMTPYDIEHAGTATGLFANRNHLATFLACAMVLLPALRTSEGNRQSGLLAMAAALVLFTGILASTSRAGIALGGLALAVTLLLWLRPSPRVILIGGAALCLGGLALLQLPALDPVFDRFATLAQDQRIDMAETTWAAARAYFPAGSGWGSFVPVFMGFEDLDTMNDRFVVAAHNDYLQLLLEGGLLGLAAALAAPLALLTLAGVHWRCGAGPSTWGLWWTAAILLLHSAVDFPLRTDALAALFALVIAMQDNRQKPLPAEGSDG